MLPTGRIRHGPAELIDRTILGPRFDWELDRLLDHYQWIELVLVSEYRRMGLLSEADAARVGAVLSGLTAERVAAERSRSMSDLLFAVERCVYADLSPAPVAWHVDRSRNDVQSCAQLMDGRGRLLAIASALAKLSRTAVARAGEHADAVMPGYTQHQTAQAITFGFYLAALAETVERAAHSLVALYDSVNLCPLGAGAMAGLELAWDRDRMARLLGFSAPQQHALTSVATREWALRAGAELAVLGTMLGRFLTDLLWWSGSSCRFLDLPDELAGVSSAMPHKRNFPVLERLRGMASHLSGLGMDVLIGQHNTGYTNLVEVSKESSRFLADLFTIGETLPVLFELVLSQVRLDSDRAVSAARSELLAASSVANHLTLKHGIPARTAQVVVGAWISEAIKAGGPGHDLHPADLRASDLAAAAGRHGYPLAASEVPLAALLDVEHDVLRRRTGGSTHPQQIRLLLDNVAHRLDETERRAAGRSASLASARSAAAVHEQVTPS